MFDIGGGELLLIFLAVLLLFGPKKIPEIAQMLGKGMQQLRKAQSQFQSQMNEIKYEINKSVDSNVTVNNDAANNKPVKVENQSAVLIDENTSELTQDPSEQKTHF